MASGEGIRFLINSVFVLNGGLNTAFAPRVHWADCGTAQYKPQTFKSTSTNIFRQFHTVSVVQLTKVYFRVKLPHENIFCYLLFQNIN